MCGWTAVLLGSTPAPLRQAVCGLFKPFSASSPVLSAAHLRPLESAGFWPALARRLARRLAHARRECELLVFCRVCWQREFEAGKEEGPPGRVSPAAH
jgi:hypothetical protein